MEITRRSSPEGLELAVNGRLDAYWADHLTSALDEVIRDGVVQLALDLSEVGYISSGGIRALLVAHREIGRVGGALRIVRPSEAVRSMLEMAGLLDLLVLRPQAPAEVGTTGREVGLEGGSLEVWDAASPAAVDCRLIGDPAHLAGGFADAGSSDVAFAPGSFGLGIGAFGSGFEDCRGRFGELLAVAGAAAYLPTDGTNVPDFLVAKGAMVPRTCMLYGVACSGELATHARFETVDHPIAFSRLVRTALELSGAQAVGLVVVAETTGLVGASLRRSPALATTPPQLAFPQIRQWLSFTSDRAWSGCQTLVVGVASRPDDAGTAPLRSFLRPLDGDGTIGHFHAAAFSYRPLPRGPLELQPTVAGLFETEALRGLLHLVNDDRPTGGLGESELRRGALWLAPITVAGSG